MHIVSTTTCYKKVLNALRLMPYTSTHLKGWQRATPSPALCAIGQPVGCWARPRKSKWRHNSSRGRRYCRFPCFRMTARQAKMAPLGLLGLPLTVTNARCGDFSQRKLNGAHTRGETGARARPTAIRRRGRARDCRHERTVKHIANNEGPIIRGGCAHQPSNLPDWSI